MSRSFQTAALLAALASAPAAAGTRMTGGQQAVHRSASAAAGGESSGTGLRLLASVGEVASGAHLGASLSLRAGLLPVFVQPGAVASISAVSKSTGELELSWNAPGLDGDAFDVSGGVFRVDYSTDAAYPFSPSSFKLEIPAAHSPGQLYSRRIPGLLPNATYYARVYLGDAAKTFADYSDPFENSTLANAVDPSISAVYPSSVAISWALAAGGAAGYQAAGSSAAFGVGLDLTSSTPSGAPLTLVVSGLSPGTTYFFRVASLNWQSDRSYSVILATVTPVDILPLPVLGFAASGNPGQRTAVLSWTNPAFAGLQGVLVLVSTSAFESPIADGSSYAPGQSLPAGELVRSTATAVSLSDAGLLLNTTYYYRARSIARNSAYPCVSTTLFLDLPPMTPAGLRAGLAAGASAVTISWSAVKTSADGTPWRAAGAPQGFELARYEVLRATSIARASWSAVASLAASATSYSEALPAPGAVYYYKIVARDAYPDSDSAMAVSTQGDLYAVAKDGVTRLKIPSSLTADLLAASGRHGDLVARAELVPEDSGATVLSSARLRLLKSPSGAEVSDFRFSRPEAEVALAYNAQGGLVVPSGAGPAAAISESDAAARLGLYWDAGAGRFVKLFGRVDPAARTVTVAGGLPGRYQIRALARNAELSFDRSGPPTRRSRPTATGSTTSSSSPSTIRATRRSREASMT